MTDSSSSSSGRAVRVWAGGKPLQISVNRPNLLVETAVWQSLHKDAAAAALAASAQTVEGMLDATRLVSRAHSTPAWSSLAASMTEALRPINERVESGALFEALKTYQGILDSVNVSTLRAVKEATRGVEFVQLQKAFEGLGLNSLFENHESMSGTTLSDASGVTPESGEGHAPEELREIAQDFRKQLGPRRISKLYQQFKRHPIYRRVSDDMRSIRQGGKRQVQQLSGQDRIALSLFFAVVIYVMTLSGSIAAAKNSEIVDGLMEDAGWTPHTIAERASGGFLSVVGISYLASRRHPIDKKVTLREWR